jgi:hypothetical protein
MVGQFGDNDNISGEIGTPLGWQQRLHLGCFLYTVKLSFAVDATWEPYKKSELLGRGCDGLAMMTCEFFGNIVLVTWGVIETEADAWGVEVEVVVLLVLEDLVCSEWRPVAMCVSFGGLQHPWDNVVRWRKRQRWCVGFDMLVYCCMV